LDAAGHRHPADLVHFHVERRATFASTTQANLEYSVLTNGFLNGPCRTLLRLL
jgi:hypothetical protein